MSKIILCPNKFCVKKSLSLNKILEPKNFLGSKRFGTKKMCVQKFVKSNICLEQKLFEPKKFWDQNILEPKNFWVQKNWCPKKLGSENLGLNWSSGDRSSQVRTCQFKSGQVKSSKDR